MTDIVLVNPGDRQQVFQALGIDLAAIEPPFWVAVMAAYLRNQGFSTRIIDANALDLTPSETAAQAAALDPRLVAVIVYGSQPSASTQNMTVAGRICSAMKAAGIETVALGGLHPSALPRQTVLEEDVDFVVDGEGPLTLEALLHELKSGDPDYERVNGLWWIDAGQVRSTPRFPVVSDLDQVLPVAAWDLLPMERYRAHNWHCFDDIENRSPYGAIYTSLGCPFRCEFCCINAPFGKPMLRRRSPERVLEEIDVLVNEYGIRNLKIVDELFVLRESHYMAILDGIIDRGYDLNIWVYARVDTVQPHVLHRMKQAGVNWIALGIESANPDVREGIAKKMGVPDIKVVVREIQAAGIRVIGNFIFGLPDDTHETMRETLDMAIDLNCEFVNFYSAMAYPGSALYGAATAEGWQLPESWHGFSQHAYDTLPLRTHHLSAAEVLEFRDDAFHHYFAQPRYLAMLEEQFGPRVRRHVEALTETQLRRKLLGHEQPVAPVA